jgi:hypothetical protein
MLPGRQLFLRDPGRPATEALGNPHRRTALFLIALCLCVNAHANMIDLNAPRIPIGDGQFSRLVLLWFFTLLIEVPVVAGILRGCMPVLQGACLALFANLISYPIAFYLYWETRLPFVAVEVCATAIEFVLLTLGVLVVDRFASLDEYPRPRRILITAIVANGLSSAFGAFVLPKLTRVHY